MNKLSWLLLYLLPLFFSFYTYSNDVTEGNKLFQKHCSECHQNDGNSKEEGIPKIAGFSAILNFDILDQFKSDDRKGRKIKTEDGSETDMNSIVQNLKENEIEAISIFLSEQSFKPNLESHDQKLAKAGKEIHMDLCENCHVEQGTSPIEDTPILRGQWKSYLTKQFEVLSKKERYMPKRMKKRFRKLSDEDKKALIEFYISPMKAE